MTAHSTTHLPALLFSAALVAASATIAAAQDLTVVLGYIADVESYGPIRAKEMGYFEDEGLNVTVIPAGTGVDQVQMVTAGIAQVGIVGPEQIIAGQARGESFIAFGGQFQKSPTAMTCRKDSGVTTPAELPGKKVGVKQGGASNMFTLFMKKNGLAPDAVEVTTIGGQDISLIIAGQIDCMITTFAFNEPMLIEQAGVPVNVLGLGSYGLNAQMNSYFARADFFNEPANKELITKFMRAEMRAWADYFADPAAAGRYMVEGGFYDGLNLEQQIFQATAQVEYMTSPLTKENGLFWLDPAIWVETAENVHASGVTDTVVDTSGMITNEILEAISPPKF